MEISKLRETDAEPKKEASSDTSEKKDDPDEDDTNLYRVTFHKTFKGNLTKEERIHIKFVQTKKGLINGAVSKEILEEAEHLEVKNRAPPTPVTKKNVSKEMAVKIHDKCAPFIMWVKEAKEKSEESSDNGM